MNPTTTGYYSVIQYCPDHSRMEAVNIGVLLFVESLGYLNVQFTRDNRRIRRFFSKEYELDSEYINISKNMLQQRIKIEAENLNAMSQLESFLNRFANEILFSPLRTIRVETPEVELSQLYKDLVSDPQPKESPLQQGKTLKKEIKDRFEQPDLASKLERDVEILVPVLDDKLHADYTFQNGRFNLIQIQEFNHKQTSSLISAACKIAAEGNMLYNHPDPKHNEQQLLLVASFAENLSEKQEGISQMMKDHNVQFFKDSDLDSLEKLIKETAH